MYSGFDMTSLGQKVGQNRAPNRRAAGRNLTRARYSKFKPYK